MNDYLKGLISGVFAIGLALLTYILGRYQKNADYKNEFYKKIIENRFTAYKIVEGIIATLSPSVKKEDGEDSDYLIVFWVTLQLEIQQQNLNLDKQYDLNDDYKGVRGEKEDETYGFRSFSKTIAEALRQEAWLSTDLNNALDELFKLLVVISFEYDDIYSSHVIPERPRTLADLGRKYNTEIIKLRKKIKNIFYEDIIHLHEVNDFIESKKRILEN